MAEKLGWSFVDIDDEIVRLCCRPITQVFEQEGESKFRQLERDVIREACKREKVVNGIYTWVVELPIKVNYESSGENKPSHGIYQIKVVRTTDTAKGIGIEFILETDNVP